MLVLCSTLFIHTFFPSLPACLVGMHETAWACTIAAFLVSSLPCALPFTLLPSLASATCHACLSLSYLPPLSKLPPALPPSCNTFCLFACLLTPSLPLLSSLPSLFLCTSQTTKTTWHEGMTCTPTPFPTPTQMGLQTSLFLLTFLSPWWWIGLWAGVPSGIFGHRRTGHGWRRRALLTLEGRTPFPHSNLRARAALLRALLRIAFLLFGESDPSTYLPLTKQLAAAIL